MIQLGQVVTKPVEVHQLAFIYFCNSPALNLNLLQGCCRSKQMLINELLPVLKQPAIDKSFPLTLK